MLEVEIFQNDFTTLLIHSTHFFFIAEHMAGSIRRQGCEPNPYLRESAFYETQTGHIYYEANK